MEANHAIAFEICDKEKCTACGACLNICSAGAIEFSEDEYGQLHPVVHLDKCISCGQCVKICANSRRNMLHKPSHCYAAWTSDKEKRNECASGGIATLLSEYVIKERKGVVFGTAYDEIMTPCVTWTDTIDGVEKFRGSKYVKSKVGKDVFRRVRQFLDEGRFVLFVGTPCQISGLLSFLGAERENLLTVDLLCHGVSPIRYFLDEVDYLKRKHKIDRIGNIRFRGNDDDNSKISFFDRLIGRYNSNNYMFTIWGNDENGSLRRFYKKDPTRNFYLAAFLKGISLRESCYSCRYASPDRVADITLGDFIGLGKAIPFDWPIHNVSAVLTNTSKGVELYSSLVKSNKTVHSIERSYEERLQYPYSLVKPFPRHRLNKKFRSLCRKRGYRHAVASVLRMPLFRDFIVKHIVHFSRLPVYACCKIREKYMRKNANR